jgi:hypothetical protein
VDFFATYFVDEIATFLWMIQHKSVDVYATSVHFQNARYRDDYNSHHEFQLHELILHTGINLQVESTAVI